MSEKTSIPDAPTAAVLLIGDEILSGRTKDKNLGYIADWLTALGIDLKEARVVPDVEAEIVAAVNALRGRYTYVFTTGGIGPTHDDITADAVAKAFGVPISHDPEAKRLLLEYFTKMGREANEARLRMARLPQGATMIANPVSIAPGFRIGNVHVMAGVPRIMQAMLEEIAPTLARGAPMRSVTVTIRAGEGDIAAGLGAIQDQHPKAVIGSYPFEENGRFGSNIVVRSRDLQTLESAAASVERLAGELTAAGKAAGFQRQEQA
ncbi:MAG: competence/damage-inducible protein A [Hyphomicrobiales bacterium]